MIRRRKKKKSPKQGTVTTYRGIKYRSKWEVYIAKLMFYSELNFKYEPRRFFLTKHLSYLPDFYIPEDKVWLEVKGFLNEKDKVQINLFRKMQTLVYLGKDELAYISGKSPSLISKMNVVKHVPDKDELLRFRQIVNNVKNKSPDPKYIDL